MYFYVFYLIFNNEIKYYGDFNIKNILNYFLKYFYEKISKKFSLSIYGSFIPPPYSIDNLLSIN
ncbi:hypothetical protein MBBAR_6c01310 [Methanobrevibacter arboriphilus JCM 13429 = DSM 1125]|uniref:Uncharacterized protein n=1 Tax=Methanobrevibacter arboriphilus JCM 13429 = DSM 1125 TaxID=1300164 RepID=A0A1V6N2X1_METAZ|nr:hypothetical protein MBBAR_6c01310 [Methanobrevibacter arboriphilus JCM 13429 = DSM 1125]